MPRVTIMTPYGLCYDIATRQTETMLHAWFDEVLPYAYTDGRPGIDDFERIWPTIRVWPMWAWVSDGPPGTDPDWPLDSRVLGRIHPFPAHDGDSGLRELGKLHSLLAAEIRSLREPARARARRHED